eukprot:6210856-Pleurochrysis_carterae.AAC.2
MSPKVKPYKGRIGIFPLARVGTTSTGSGHLNSFGQCNVVLDEDVAAGIASQISHLAVYEDVLTRGVVPMYPAATTINKSTSSSTETMMHNVAQSKRAAIDKIR